MLRTRIGRLWTLKGGGSMAAAAAAAVVVAPGGTTAQPSGLTDRGPSGDELVEFSVAVEHSPFNPEAGTTLALVYEVEPGWHIYWRNNGDTGAPPSWTIEAPAGVEIGEAEWPAPERYSSAGGFIVDYVLEDRAVILLPLRIEPGVMQSMIDAGTGELTIRVSTEWLVCKDVCLPGAAEREVTIPFAATDGVPANEELFEGARERLPRAMESAPGGPVRASFEEGRLRITAPGARRIVFFPYESDEGVTPENMREGLEAEGRELTIAYSEASASADRVRGVARVSYGQDESARESAVLIDVPGPGHGGESEQEADSETDREAGGRDASGAGG